MCALVLWVAAITLVVGDLAWRTRAKGRMPGIATADVYLVALKSDGSLWAMGRNLGGVSIGDGTTAARSMELVPVKIDNLGPLPAQPEQR
jgi:hypothetical protein